MDQQSLMTAGMVGFSLDNATLRAMLANADERGVVLTIEPVLTGQALAEWIGAGTVLQGDSRARVILPVRVTISVPGKP